MKRWCSSMLQDNALLVIGRIISAAGWTDSNGIRELITGPQTLIYCGLSAEPLWSMALLCLEMLHLIETKSGSCCPEYWVSLIISHNYPTDNADKVQREPTIHFWHESVILAGRRINSGLCLQKRDEVVDVRRPDTRAGFTLRGRSDPISCCFFPPPCVTDHNRKMSM